VMEGSGDTPMLLVDGKASPHAYALKPSQVSALQKADIVFYISDEFELFLQKTLANLPTKTARVAMDKETSLVIVPIRTTKDFGGNDETQAKDAPRDLHYWLMARNAQEMVMEIARELSMVYPDKRTLYFDNARKENERIGQMQISMESRLRPLRDKNFIVFHDVLQYFENDYGLKAAGAITAHPDVPPGARHIGELRDKIKTLGTVCVFREPSFEGKVIENILAGTGAKTGVLDAEGALLTPGIELYFQQIESIDKSLETCLL
jgi:zinc transport system substrate-binding protein